MLSDDQYERISPFLPGKASDPGRTAADNRLGALKSIDEPCLWHRSVRRRFAAVRLLRSHPIFPKKTECKQTVLQNNSSWL
ncbi:hypothetical protein CE195_12725 [Sodalis-like symbiont of Philaenus spumarius]|nr:hypothetical protein CE195_12725 [Sodalis-like symbiont of Philaenus spumarius]